MRRKVLVLAGVVLMMLTGSLALWLNPRGHRIHLERFGQIEVGMTERQVEDLLGGPPGDYSKGAIPLRQTSVGMLVHGRDDVRTWLGDEGVIDVAFDTGGTVTCTDRNLVMHDTFMDKLRRWLGL